MVGWLAVFPPDGSPELVRFGPAPVERSAAADPAAGTGRSGAGDWCRVGDNVIGAGYVRGAAGKWSWDLELEGGEPPLWTFPSWSWRREVLPGSQVLARPGAAVRGKVVGPGGVRDLDARGALARIYGHGSAQRWCWLHADLDGGGTLEVVAATPRRPGLRRLPLVPMVQLRLPGEPDWPAHGLAAAARFRARVDGDRFTVRGAVGHRRLSLDVHLPAQRCVSVGYVDPDGATATCVNSERADAVVVVEDSAARSGSERRWTLAARAHAEIGSRP